MKHLVRILPFMLLIVLCSTLHAGEMRRWTGSNGKVIEAEFLALEGDIVKIKVKTGREMNVLLSNFAEKDQEIIKKLGAGENPFGDASTPENSDDGELLSFTDFRNNRMPDDESFKFVTGKFGKISNENSVFKIICEPRNGEAIFTPWGTFGPVDLKKGVAYRFTIEVKSDKPATFSICPWSVERKTMAVPWTQVQVKPEWEELTIDFRCKEDTLGRIAMNMFAEDRTYEIRKISLKRLNSVTETKSDTKDAEVLRVTLEISERGKCKARLEKVPKGGGSTFKGQVLTMPVHENTKVAVAPNGLSNIVVDFSEGEKPPLFCGNYSIDEGKGVAILSESGRNIVTGDKTTQLPAKFVFDISPHGRQALSTRLLFHRERTPLSQLHFLVKQHNNDTYEMDAGWNLWREKVNEVHRFGEQNIKLDKPFEKDFILPLPDEHLASWIRLHLSWGSEYRQGLISGQGPMAFSRIEITGKQFIRLGFNAVKNGDKIVLTPKEGEPSSAIGRNFGLESDMELVSINDKPVRDVAEANKQLDLIPVESPFSLTTRNKGRTQTIEILSQ